MAVLQRPDRRFGWPQEGAKATVGRANSLLIGEIVLWTLRAVSEIRMSDGFSLINMFGSDLPSASNPLLINQPPLSLSPEEAMSLIEPFSDAVIDVYKRCDQNWSERTQFIFAPDRESGL
jgi:hypothetical protein